MTRHPALDTAGQAPALPTPSSANGTQPGRPADLHAAERAAAESLTAFGIDPHPPTAS